mmetsp:Transcript_21752/g.33801  ORF Transcript_21752/g.33801 Transcript_21752/m.33801 type:complete len:457 (-) Transcript_21752:189-1559(-)
MDGKEVVGKVLEFCAKDDAKYVFALIICLVFANVLRRISSSSVRLWFSLVCGVSVSLAFLQYSFIHSFITILVTGLMLFVVPKFPNFESVALTFIWTHLIYIRLYTDVQGVGNAFQLILTLKLSSLCWDIKDHETKGKKNDGKDAASFDIPSSFFEYLCYVYFLPGAFTGPFFTYDDYLSAIDDNHRTSRNPCYMLPTTRPPPTESTWKRHLLLFIPILALYLLFEKFLPFSYVKTVDYLAQPFYYRFWYYIISAYSLRLKFYFVWTVAESGCTAARVGYPYEVRTVDIYELETTNSAPDFTKFWNMAVVRFLNVFTRKRIPSFIPRPLHIWIVFLTSSIWHGVRPVYYLSFGIGGLWITASQSLAYIGKKFLPPPEKRSRPFSILLFCFTYFLTHAELNFAGGLFSTLDLKIAFRVMDSLYFFGVIGPLICIFLGFVASLVPSSKEREAKDKKRE